MNEYLAQELREAQTRDKSDGWVSVFVAWIPNMIIAVVLVSLMLFGMYYVEHGTLDITKDVVYQHSVTTKS